jgi:hypothetical protein
VPRHQTAPTRPIGVLCSRATAALAITVAGLLAGCSSGSSPTPAQGPAQIQASQRAAAQRVQEFPVGAAAARQDQKPPVPASGAYFGAWVQPFSYTQPGRQSAVLGFEAQLGRRLDIVHTYRRETETFPRPSDLAVARQGSYLMLSWAIDDAARIASGAEDAFIRERAREIRSFSAPIFLEFQWEMDRPNLAGVVHGPATYVAAWHRVYRIFAQMHVDNVAWVWCPKAAGFLTDQAPAYYPGNREVDWICVDAYPGTAGTPLSALINPFLGWAAQNGKPIMLGEFGISHALSATDRLQWIRQAEATVTSHPQIKAVVYFESGISAKEPKRDYLVAGPDPALPAFRSWADAPHFDPQHLVAQQ